VTYVCPIVILTITYTRIAIELWGQTGLFIEEKPNFKKKSNLNSLAIGEATKRQRDSIQSKRKIVKMLIAVVLIFGICW
jgi:tachykinin-like receptor